MKTRVHRESTNSPSVLFFIFHLLEHDTFHSCLSCFRWREQSSHKYTMSVNQRGSTHPSSAPPEKEDKDEQTDVPPNFAQPWNVYVGRLAERAKRIRVSFLPFRSTTLRGITKGGLIIIEISSIISLISPRTKNYDTIWIWNFRSVDRLQKN